MMAEQSRVPVRKKAGYEQYLTTSQLNPDYPTTPALTNTDYFPNADQNINIGSVPAPYGGSVPVFSGRGNLFPINTYTNRARALEEAAYHNEVAKIRKEQQAGSDLMNLFKTGDVKNPMYDQRYHAMQQIAEGYKGELYAMGGSWTEANRILTAPRTAEEVRLANKVSSGMNNLKHAENMIDWFSDAQMRYEKSERDGGKIFLPEYKKAMEEWRTGKTNILENPKEALYKEAIYRDVNEDIGKAVSQLKQSVTEKDSGLYLVKDSKVNDSQSKAVAEAHVLDPSMSQQYRIIQAQKENRSPNDISDNELVRYWGNIFKEAHGTKKELTAKPEWMQRSEAFGGLQKRGNTWFYKTTIKPTEKEQTSLLNNMMYEAVAKEFPTAEVVNRMYPEAKVDDKALGQWQSDKARELLDKNKKMFILNPDEYTFIPFGHTDVTENKEYDLKDENENAVKGIPLGYVIQGANKKIRVAQREGTDISIIDIPYNEYNAKIKGEFSGYDLEQMNKEAQSNVKVKDYGKKEEATKPTSKSRTYKYKGKDGRIRQAVISPDEESDFLKTYTDATEVK